MFSQSIVLLIMGVSGSGKTHIGKLLADKLGFYFMDADQYHTLSNKRKMSKGIPLTDIDRMPWLNKLAEFIHNALKEEQKIILACSALKEEYRKILLTQVPCYYILYLQGNFDLFKQRLAYRKHEYMNPNLLKSQFATLEEPKNAIYLNAHLPADEIVEYACAEIKEAEKYKGRIFDCC